MRRFFLAVAVVIAPAPLMAHEADQYLVAVCRQDVPDCEQKRTAFRKQYKAAFRNDLAAQRVVAQTLWRGSDVVPAQWRAGCAWHLTINALRPKGLGENDLENMRENCGLLSPDQIELARADAGRLGHRILSGGKLDERLSKPARKRLDDTAEPL